MISFDAATTVDEASALYGGPGPPFLPRTFSHAGGTGLGGVIIFASARMSDSVDNSCKFTYDGLTVPQIGGSPQYRTTSAGIYMKTQAFVLSGTDADPIPDGTVDVVIDTDDQVNEVWSIVVVTLATTSGKIEEADVQALLATTADPYVTLTNTADAYMTACLLSDHDSVSDLAPASGCTDIFEDDHGVDMSAVVRRTSIESPGSYAVGWVATIEESAVLGLAIQELVDSETLFFWGWGMQPV